MLKSQKKNSLIINNTIELGELTTEANGKGRKFISRFIEAGVAHYEQFGDVLITKETLDKFIQTMVGCPVIIKHKDITDQNADKERVGVVSRVWFDENDGWFYCEGVIWDKQAIDLVKNQGWNVSCTYDFESDFQKGTYHGKEIDMEFTGGEFLHLALVPNPRYERATIIMNSKDNEKGRWVTIKGTHVFIPDGKQIEEVMKERGWFSEGKESKKEEKDDLKGKYSREDADFDEEQAKKDIEEAKKRGYDTVEKISEYLGLDEDEVRGFEDEEGVELEIPEEYKSKKHPLGITLDLVDKDELIEEIKKAPKGRYISDEYEQKLYKEAVREFGDPVSSKFQEAYEQVWEEIEDFRDQLKEKKERKSTFDWDDFEKWSKEKEGEKSKEPQIGDYVTFDTNWRGVKAKIKSGKIVGKEKETASHGDTNPDYLYKVKTDAGKTVFIKKEAIEAARRQDGSTSAKNSISNDLIDAIADVICDEVCNSTDFFEKGSGEQ